MRSLNQLLKQIGTLGYYLTAKSGKINLSLLNASKNWVAVQHKSPFSSLSKNQTLNSDSLKEL